MEKQNKQNIIKRLRKTIRVLESKHTRSVKVMFRGTDGDIRVYDAETIVRGVKHHYTVRVEDYFDDTANALTQNFRCNCSGAAYGLKCRHILKTAELDAEILNKDLNQEIFQNYHAHENDGETAAELERLFAELPETVQKDVLLIVKTYHREYGFGEVEE